jgi:hypothetical protein
MLARLALSTAGRDEQAAALGALAEALGALAEALGALAEALGALAEAVTEVAAELGRSGYFDAAPTSPTTPTTPKGPPTSCRSCRPRWTPWATGNARWSPRRRPIGCTDAGADPPQELPGKGMREITDRRMVVGSTTSGARRGARMSDSALTPLHTPFSGNLPRA